MGLRQYFPGLSDEPPPQDRGSILQGMGWLFALHLLQSIWFVLGPEGFLLLFLTQVVYAGPLAVFFALRGRNLSAWGVVLGCLLTAVLGLLLLSMLVLFTDLDLVKAVRRL